MPPRLRTAAELAEKSPSSLDGIPVLQQARIHRYGGLAVQLLCKELRAPVATMTTGCYLYHSFYAQYSLRTATSFTVAVACVVVGCKIQNTPRKWRDIVDAARTLVDVFPDSYLQNYAKSSSYDELRSELVQLEKYVYEAVGYALAIPSPLAPLIGHLRLIHVPLEIVRFAWKIALDSFFTTVCLRHSPHVVAAAAIHLALVAHDRHPPYWWADLVSPADLPNVDDVVAELIALKEECSQERLPLACLGRVSGNTPPALSLLPDGKVEVAVAAPAKEHVKEPAPNRRASRSPRRRNGTRSPSPKRRHRSPSPRRRGDSRSPRRRDRSPRRRSSRSPKRRSSRSPKRRSSRSPRRHSPSRRPPRDASRSPESHRPPSRRQKSPSGRSRGRSRSRSPEHRRRHSKDRSDRSGRHGSDRRR